MAKDLNTKKKFLKKTVRRVVLIVFTIILIIVWQSFWGDFFLVVENCKIIAEGISQVYHLRLARIMGVHKLAAQGDIKLLQALLEEQPELVHSRDSRGRTPLHHAALNGHRDACNLIQGFGGSPEDTDNDDKQPIDLAFQNDHYELQYLTTAKFQNQQHEFGKAFCQAIKEGNSSEVNRLLDENSEIIDEIGSQFYDPCSPYRPLQQAVIDGNKALFKLLIERGLKINDPRNGTPLLTAVQHNRREMAVLAVNYGADVNLGNPPPLHAAARNNAADLLEYLIDHGAEVNESFSKSLPGDMESKSPATALDIALVSGNVQAARVLLSHGATASDFRFDLDLTWCLKYPKHYLKDATIMHLAAIQGYADIIDLLAQRNIYPEAASPLMMTYSHFPYHGGGGHEDGALTPLEVAAISGHNDAILMLLKNGAQFQSSRFTFDADGKMEQSLDNATILHVAAMRGNTDVVTTILDHRMDPNCTCGYEFTYTNYLINGWTPLHIAAYLCPNNSLITMMEKLIASGADINAVTSETGHENPANHVVTSETDHENPVNLERMPVALLTMVRDSKQEVDFRAILMLLEKGADPTSRDKEGRTLLLWAARNHRLDIIQLLIGKSIDLQEKDYNGRTALHWAALGFVEYGIRDGRQIDVSRFLAEQGVNINARDKSGATPLHYAAMNGDLELIRFLVSNGAYINIIDYNEETPLDYAFKKDHRIGEYLLPELSEYGAKSKKPR